ncbi:WYL domain-containing protein [Microbispora hainanensis]|uniref:helix-turn-helix transcriptional regulator n=1 Tax=Microbispora TaxID=2005 RepID=UPI0021B00015|nr:MULTISPECIES: WYL domain-containing protein [Microbispora]
MRAATVAVPGHGPTVDPETLISIAAAVRDHETLRFDYLGHRGGEGRRTAEPHRLVFTGRRWYLPAWDVDRDDWRTFRADRMRLRVPNGPRFTPREPPEDGAAAHVVRGAGSAAWRHRAVVRLHAPADVVGARLTAAAGLPRADGADACVLETGGDSLHNLTAFLTGLDVPCTVLDPPELRDHLRAPAGRYLDAAGGRRADNV